MHRTRWSLVFAAVLCVLPATAFAQGVVGPKRQVTQLEEAWIAAVIKRDSAAFDRLLAPNFVYTEDDRVYTKAQLIREVITSTDTVTAGRNEDLVVRIYGTTAVATGWLILSGRGPKGPFEVRYRYTDTWVRMGGGNRWRVVAAQDYKKP